MFSLVMKFVGFFGHIKAFNYLKIKINFKEPTNFNGERTKISRSKRKNAN
jgi:hypothetical protein